MKLSTVLVTSLFATVIACGGEPKPAASPETTSAPAAEGKEGHHGEHHKDGADHQKEHDKLAPALKDFHGAIAPVWHTPAGKERVEKACTNTKPMAEKAQATGDAELIAAVGQLEPACAKEGRPEVEAKLSTVHDRFHALAKMAKHD